MKNYKILQLSRRIEKGQEYFDPDSKLNCRVLEYQEQEETAIGLIELLASSGGPEIGYDVVFCRDRKLPKTNDWGMEGWSYRTKIAAENHYQKLLKAKL